MADAADQSGQATFSERLQQFKYDGKPPQSANSSPRSPTLGDQTLRSSSASPLKRTRSNSTPTTEKKRRLRTPVTSPLRKPSSKYAAPAQYAHLSPLVDVLEPNLLLVFVGVNPGISTATQGHAYAHPSNRFWHLLHTSGLTTKKHRPSEDRDLPKLYGYGNTNIVARPTKDQAELSKEEMIQGTADLEAKFRAHKPEAVCIVGKGIWEAIWRYKHGRGIAKAEFHYGWQDETENMGRGEDGELDAHGRLWKGSRVFVATSTSGLAAAIKPAEREAIWKILGDSIAERRTASELHPREPAPPVDEAVTGGS